MASAHVVPNGLLWTAKGNGAVISNHSNQGLAIVAARGWLSRNGGGELNIHAQDGSVRAKDTVYPGNDPRNTKG
jgi:hypothetical protein